LRKGVETGDDVALLRPFLREPDSHVGTAQYLLDANPHLGRALRFRARRWTVRSWTVADGLVAPKSGESPCEGALEAIAEHALSARSFSPTALQNFASCPYKLFLYTVLRLGPREVPEAIEEMDPLQVGSLVHAVQYRLLTRLRDEGALPVRPASLERARDVLDEVLDALAAEEKERLHPAIERTWEDGIAAIRADLREWLRRASEDESGWTPWKFELAFGLPEDRDADPDSRPEPVRLDSGLAVRGSIDLVEKDASGALRATDHKTGKQRVKDGEIVSGGASLQPVLYALAVERLFPDARVDSGRLYYCTTRGGFEEASVPLDDAAREAARVVAETVQAALEGPFLPAAPAPRACEWCDYQVVCGPYEERRTGSRRKNPKGLAELPRLRKLP